MSRQVRKGSYWRHAPGLGDPVIYKAEENGSPYELLEFSYKKEGKEFRGFYQVLSNNHMKRLYRCKKNGDWFGPPSEAQRANREFLSLRWQALGAFASLKRMAAELDGKEGTLRLPTLLLEERFLLDIEVQRQKAVQKAQEKAREKKGEKK